MDHKEIEDYFNEGRFAKDTIKFKIVSQSSYKRDTGTKWVYGVTKFDKNTTWNLLCECDSVKTGLPEFTFSSKVFARNFILTPFRLFNLARKNIKTGISTIDKRMDFYCRNREEVNQLKAEFPVLFQNSFSNLISGLDLANFKGDVIYNSLTLNYKSIGLPENEKDLKTVEVALDFMKVIREQLNYCNRDPVQAVKRGYISLESGEYTKGIKWSDNEGEFAYPNYTNEVLSFINILSVKFWEDTNYTQKPVTDWLQNPMKLETLSIDELKSVITYILRQERFCEGFWLSTFEKGYFKFILRNRIFSKIS